MNLKEGAAQLGGKLAQGVDLFANAARKVLPERPVGFTLGQRNPLPQYRLGAGEVIGGCSEVACWRSLRNGRRKGAAGRIGGSLKLEAAPRKLPGRRVRREGADAAAPTLDAAAEDSRATNAANNQPGAGCSADRQYAQDCSAEQEELE